MTEAQRIIEHGLKSPGFLVAFEAKTGSILTSDWFPEPHAGEELIASQEEAWKLARAFAAQTVGRCINIHVCDAAFCPVDDSAERLIENRQK